MKELKELSVTIVGATGLVGREFIKVLEQRRFPVSSIRLCASDRSVKRKLFFNHREVEVEVTSQQSFEHTDLALFSAGSEVSRYFSPIAARAGALVIDNSAAFRMDPEVPLVIPEVNPEDIKNHRGIVANPNCATIQMLVVLFPLHKVNPIKRVVVDTYQSVSGTGIAAMQELTTQLKLILEGRGVIPHVYPHQIAFNLLPEIDVFLDNGYTREEWKLVEETQKIMHSEELAISATCVRVPVWIGHSAAVHVEFTKPITPDDVRRILAEAPGVRVLDDPVVSLYPQPWSVAGSDDVLVGRIRRDVSCSSGVAMWLVADNLRKGAALNAIQIAETVIRNGWM
jgi:aspartate-semialdehyde dehydrogenase